MNVKLSGRPLTTFIEDAATLSNDKFAEKNGHFFLLLQEALNDEPTSGRTLSESDAHTTGSIVFLAFPLRRKKNSQVRFVSIGRTANNDVVLPERSISKFHAFFPNPVEPLIHDGGSFNGTFVNGEKVCERGAGPATKLEAGDTLKMGILSLTFFDLSSFLRLVQR